VDALTHPPGGKGPRVDAAELEELRGIARSAQPPLTDADVTELLTRLQSAEGKTVEEVLDSVRGALAARQRRSTTGQETAPGETAPRGTAPGDPAQAQAAETKPVAASGTAQLEAQRPPASSHAGAVDDLVTRAKPDPAAKKDPKIDEKLEQTFSFIERGMTCGLGPQDLELRPGVKFTGSVVGRDPRTGQLFFGRGTLVLRREGGQLVVAVPAGILLRNSSGTFGRTKRFTMPARRQTP
jgi:hypothetical protein